MAQGTPTEIATPTATQLNRASIKRLARVSLLAAVALVLSYLETMLPLPLGVPGVKLGLANAAVLVAFCVCDARAAAGVAVVKVLAVGFLFGSPLTMVYSFAGTALSFAAMVLLFKAPKLGVVFISMVGAIFHNAGQLAVAALILQTPSILLINLPWLTVVACITGFATGAVAAAILKAFPR